jgi:hypothetical protein
MKFSLEIGDNRAVIIERNEFYVLIAVDGSTGIIADIMSDQFARV